MAKRKIIVTSSFKRDIKRRYLELVTAEWAEVLDCLVANNPLPEKYLDHPLKGGAEFKNCRDSIVKSDLENEIKSTFEGILSFRISAPTDDIISPSAENNVLTLGTLSITAEYL